jgi:hypothetical protein
MDKSKEYVKMCQEAQELQEIFDNGGCIENATHSAVWLPRQDQLQEMLNDEGLYDFIGGLNLNWR